MLDWTAGMHLLFLWHRTKYVTSPSPSRSPTSRLAMGAVPRGQQVVEVGPKRTRTHSSLAPAVLWTEEGRSRVLQGFQLLKENPALVGNFPVFSIVSNLRPGEPV